MRSELQFSRQQIELAITIKHLRLDWEPAVGNYVYDGSDAVKPSSPFQDGVYFLLNYDCFMQKVGGLDRFKELMTWLPTWNDARKILRSLGVSNREVQERLVEAEGIERDAELLVLYDMIAEVLSRSAAPAASNN